MVASSIPTTIQAARITVAVLIALFTLNYGGGGGGVGRTGGGMVAAELVAVGRGVGAWETFSHAASEIEAIEAKAGEMAAKHPSRHRDNVISKLSADSQIREVLRTMLGKIPPPPPAATNAATAIEEAKEGVGRMGYDSLLSNVYLMLSAWEISRRHSNGGDGTVVEKEMGTPMTETVWPNEQHKNPGISIVEHIGDNNNEPCIVLAYSEIDLKGHLLPLKLTAGSIHYKRNWCSLAYTHKNMGDVTGWKNYFFVMPKEQGGKPVDHFDPITVEQIHDYSWALADPLRILLPQQQQQQQQHGEDKAERVPPAGAQLEVGCETMFVFACQFRMHFIYPHLVFATPPPEVQNLEQLAEFLRKEQAY